MRSQDTTGVRWEERDRRQWGGGEREKEREREREREKERERRV